MKVEQHAKINESIDYKAMCIKLQVRRIVWTTDPVPLQDGWMEGGNVQFFSLLKFLCRTFGKGEEFDVCVFAGNDFMGCFRLKWTTWRTRIES